MTSTHPNDQPAKRGTPLTISPGAPNWVAGPANTYLPGDTTFDEANPTSGWKGEPGNQSVYCIKVHYVDAHITDVPNSLVSCQAYIQEDCGMPRPAGTLYGRITVFRTKGMHPVSSQVKIDYGPLGPFQPTLVAESVYLIFDGGIDHIELRIAGTCGTAKSFLGPWTACT